MILAEKITMLRKQKGWSQEELAMRLDISRQSVSKWESNQSLPDLDKIIKLSELFDVSTDYLLKNDEKEESKNWDDSQNNFGQWDLGGTYNMNAGSDSNEQIPPGDKEKAYRMVSKEEADAFMETTERVAGKIALGVSVCILSPVLLLILCGLAEACSIAGLTEEMAGGFGVVVLLIMVAGAVAVLIVNGMQLSRFEYFEKEVFVLDEGILENVVRKKEDFEHTFRSRIAAGVVLCIASVVPLMLAAAFDAADSVYIHCTAMILVIVSIGVNLFVRSGMKMECYNKLLQREEYTHTKKMERKKTEPFAGIYWCVITAVYLGVSFWSMRWDRTWIIWPCAGVMFAAISGIINMADGQNN